MSEAEIKPYNGNPLLKQVGQVIEFTKEQVQEIRKCKKDPIYFIENYCKIVTLDEGLIPFKLYDVQKDLIRTIIENRKIIAMQPLSLIHISEPTRPCGTSRMPSSA